MNKCKNCDNKVPDQIGKRPHTFCNATCLEDYVKDEMLWFINALAFLRVKGW